MEALLRTNTMGDLMFLGEIGFRMKEGGKLLMFYLCRVKVEAVTL